ncbi:MAG TPA: hypothetical protein VFQ13_20915 [Anaerolineales bacterium]|nr:hypothetical protein [Anaerolineales bacterium]
MNKAISLFKRVLLSPGHFLLLSTYFVFRIYDFNIYEVPFRDFVRPLLLSVLMGLVLYLLFGLLAARRWHAAALMTSAWLFGFYLYGTFWELVYAKKVITQPEVFAAVWGIFFLLLIAWLGWKTPKALNPNLPAALNLMAIILLLSPVIGSLVYFVSFQMPFPSQTDHTVQAHPIQSSPDIYYIILDAYPRADVLSEEYGYDNEPFLQSLKDLGFYVAECSQSNYENTPQSLTSSLNMDYLQNMSDAFKLGEDEQMGLFKLLDDNNVQATVSNFGYRTVAFASGFFLAEWRDADVFSEPPYGPITEFEALLMPSTYLRILDSMDIVNFDDISAERYRTRTRLVLNSFDELVSMPGPKFVFIHLIIPHAPFAFDAMGNPVPPDKADPYYGYLEQVKFINKAILPRLKQLVDESPTSPVIILQGDHGPWQPPDHTAQLKILNAYYLPQGSEALYPSISPVNSFRVVFNEYFGANLPLLEDKSYYSHPFKMYEFLPMPNTCPQ